MSVLLRYLHSCVGILYHVRVLFSTPFKMSDQCITSIPHRLRPLPSEFYTTASVRTHHRESIHSQASVIRWNLHSCVGILYHVRVLSTEQILTAFKMSDQRRTSIPCRLGQLPSECYYMASTYESWHNIHTRVFSVGPSLTSKDHSHA